MALRRRRSLAALDEDPDTVGIFRSKTVSVIVQPSDMSPVEAPNHHPISATGDTPTPFQLPQSSSGAIGEILGFRAQRYQLGLGDTDICAVCCINHFYDSPGESLH